MKSRLEATCLGSCRIALLFAAAAGMLPAAAAPWTYIEVDDARSDHYFGIDAGDLNGDDVPDIASGPYVYLNPGGDMTGEWQRIDLPQGHDALLIVDVDGDSRSDLISMTGDGKVHWLEAQDATATAWSATQVGALESADHNISAQGYELVQIIPGGKPEPVLNWNGLFFFEIPADPEGGNWPMTQVAEGTREGVGWGDIDRDGKLDLVARKEDAQGRAREVAWYKNPGDGSGNWKRHHLGNTDIFCDRIEVADYNGDGRLDVACSEYTPKREPDLAKVLWFEAPADPATGDWDRHVVGTQYTLNSMDQADMNGDGAPDLITGEHRGTKMLIIWQNDGHGNFTPELVTEGKENHLGAQVFDMDADGDLDIIGIAWDGYKYLHLWRNDAKE